MALGKEVQPAAILPVDVGINDLRRFAGAYQFDEKFFRPNAQVAFRVEGKELVLDWGSGTQSNLIPVGPNEFIDRQFWSRLVFDETADGFKYAGSFEAKRMGTK
jgi:hypothetical protein